MTDESFFEEGYKRYQDHESALKFAEMLEAKHKTVLMWKMRDGGYAVVWN